MKTPRPAVPSEGKEYSAKFLLPHRVFADAYQVATLRKALPGDVQLQDYITLLSLRAVGNQLLYDATTSPPIRGHAPRKLGEALMPLDARRFLEDVVRSLAAARPVLQDLLKRPAMFGEPFDQRDLHWFFGVIARMRGAAIEDRVQIARDAQTHPRALGGKFLSGLADPSNDELLATLASPASWTARQRILSTSLTAFRTFLLARWADRIGVTFVPYRPAITILRRANSFSWTAIEQQLGRRFGGSRRGEHIYGWELPFIGRSILLSEARKGHTPMTLVERAKEIGEEWGLAELHAEIGRSFNRGKAIGLLVEELSERVWAFRDQSKSERRHIGRGRVWAAALEVSVSFVERLVETAAGVPGATDMTQLLLSARRAYLDPVSIAFVSEGLQAQQRPDGDLRAAVSQLWGGS